MNLSWGSRCGECERCHTKGFHTTEALREWAMEKGIVINVTWARRLMRRGRDALRLYWCVLERHPEKGTIRPKATVRGNIGATCEGYIFARED